MNNKNIIFLGILVAVIGYALMTLRENYTGFLKYNSRPLTMPETSPYHWQIDHGDTVLTDMYKRIHVLERIVRERVGQNNDIPGGSEYTSPREPMIMEDIDKEINFLRKKIQEIILSRQQEIPLPRLYTSNPMISVPTHLGQIHPDLPGNE